MEENRRRIDWEYDVFSHMANIGDEFFCSFELFPKDKLYPALCKRNRRNEQKFVTHKINGGVMIRRIN